MRCWRLAKTRPRVVYVKTPGTLQSTQWIDELHPKRNGFKEIAKTFRTQFKKQFRGGPW